MQLCRICSVSFLISIQDSRCGKKEKAQKASEHDYSAGAGGYIKVQGTRKVDCPESLQVRTIQLHVDYILPQSEMLSNKGLRKAKAAIDSQAVRTWQAMCETAQHSKKVLFEASPKHKPWNSSCWRGWNSGALHTSKDRWQDLSAGKQKYNQFWHSQKMLGAVCGERNVWTWITMKASSCSFTKPTGSRGFSSGIEVNLY